VTASLPLRASLLKATAAFIDYEARQASEPARSAAEVAGRGGQVLERIPDIIA